jgi:hypothetical protein
MEDIVEVKPSNMTTVDYGSRLQSTIKMAELTVSIGGYNAEVPVYIDNRSVGVATVGNPLVIKVLPGMHDVKVCVGGICINEQVIAKFGGSQLIDFGERLTREMVHTEPTVRILDFVSHDNVMTVNTKFINPSKTDLTMAATVSCVYTYSDYSKKRITTSVRSQITKLVKSGSSSNQSFTLYLSGGSDPLASAPSITEVTTK